MQKECENCHIEFASYFCSKCKLLDDDNSKGGKYHCDKCGICRISGDKKSHHCDGCNRCLPEEDIKDHICVSIDYDCSVCLLNMNTSKGEVVFMRCKHAMHLNCFRQYIRNEYKCPICKKSTNHPRYDKEI